MFFEQIAAVINKHPAVVVGIMGFVFLLALSGMTHVTMQTGSDTYLDKSTPEGVMYDRYTERFLSDNVVLLVECDDPLDYDLMVFLERFETEIEREKHVSSAVSILDLLKMYNGGVLPASTTEIKEVVKRMPPDLVRKVVPSNLMTLILVNIDQGVSTDVSRGVLHSVQSLIDSEELPPDVTIEVTGNTAFDKQMEDELSGSLGALIIAAMGMMVITLGILFSSTSHRFLPALFVAVGMVYTFGIMGLFDINMNIGVVASFPVLLGLGIDYAIQFQARFDEECRKSSLADAVKVTVTKTGPAVLLALAATCMGFIAMFVSAVPMVRSFGVVCIIGVTCCYLSSLIGFPAVALLLKYRPKHETHGKGMQYKAAYDSFLARSAVKIARNPVPVLLIAAMFAVGGIYIDSSIPIDTSEDTFVPPDMPTKLSLDRVTDMVGAVETFPLLIEGDDVTSLEAVEWTDRFGNYAVERHAELTGVTSIATYVKQYNGGVIPDTQSGLDKVLSLIPAEKRDRYVDGHTEGVMEFTTTNMEMGAESRVKSEVVDELNWVQPPPGITATPTGDFDMYTSLIDNIAIGKEQMTYLGFILILAFLILAYRRMYAASPLIPIVCIVGWNAVAMYILSINYTPMTACLGSMTIGVAAEYTILMMERYSEEKEKVADRFDAIREGVQKVGTAITVSGLVTACGFSALIISNFKIISNFGILTVIAVGFSLIGAIVMMPAALSVVGLVEGVGEKSEEKVPE